MGMTKSGLAYVILFSFSGLLSCVFFCVVYLCLLVHWPRDWPGRLYSRDIFRAEGFPLQRPD